VASSSQEALDRKHSALRQAMGPVIATALAEASVVEVMVNPDGSIWVERIGQGRTFSGEMMAPADAERILRLVADHVGEVVTRDQPLVSATLPRSGERFQGVFMPVSTAPAFTIRKRPEVIFTLDDYVKTGVMTVEQAQALRAAAERRDNILIAGGTGSGKTTLANAVLAAPVTTADLVRAALRLRPDRIIIGEVRDGSALDLLKAWNTGHPGGLATLHANSAREALSRLEDLIGEVAPRVPHRAIGQAVNLVAYIRRAPDGRRLESLVRVEGWIDGEYRLTAVAD